MSPLAGRKCCVSYWLAGDEIRKMAQTYIQDGIVPVRKIDDALHLAVCAVMEMDILLSWNYKHLANINREMRVIAYSGPWLPVIPEQSYQPFRCMVTSDSGLMVTTISGIPEPVVIMAGTLKTERERKEDPSDAG